MNLYKNFFIVLILFCFYAPSFSIEHLNENKDAKQIKKLIKIMRAYGYNYEADTLTKNKKVKICFFELYKIVPTYAQSNAITIKNLQTKDTTIYINKELINANEIGLACLLVHEAQHVKSNSFDSLIQERQAISKEMGFYLTVINKDPNIQNIPNDRLIQRLNSLKAGYDLVIETYINRDAYYQKLLNINNAK